MLMAWLENKNILVPYLAGNKQICSELTKVHFLLKFVITYTLDGEVCEYDSNVKRH